MEDDNKKEEKEKAAEPSFPIGNPRTRGMGRNRVTGNPDANGNDMKNDKKVVKEDVDEQVGRLFSMKSQAAEFDMF